MTSEDAISVILANGMLYAPKNEPTATMIQDAFDIAIKALEKQIPKNPDRGVCPSCNSRHIYAATLMKAECFKYCGDCGQALDWSDNDD